MKGSNIAGASIAGGGLVLAGLSITSDQVKGWMDVAGQLVQHPHAVVLLIVLVGVALAWLLIRCQTSEAELRGCFDRLQRAVFIALQSDEPDAIRKILLHWEAIIDGEVDLERLLALPVIERRKGERHKADEAPP